MVWLLIAMMLVVFGVTWLFLHAVAWAVFFALVALAAGAVLGGSADR